MVRTRDGDFKVTPDQERGIFNDPHMGQTLPLGEGGLF